MNKVPLLLTLTFSAPVQAYIGPGMGGGVILATVGFFAAILLALWGVLYYPIKRALKNRKSKKISSEENSDES